MLTTDTIIGWLYDTIAVEFATGTSAVSTHMVDILPLNDDWFQTTTVWDAEEPDMISKSFVLDVTDLVGALLPGPHRYQRDWIRVRRELFWEIYCAFPELRGGRHDEGLKNTLHTIAPIMVPCVIEHTDPISGDIGLAYNVLCEIRVYQINILPN